MPCNYMQQLTMEPSALKDTWNYIICNKKFLKVSFSISNGSLMGGAKMPSMDGWMTWQFTSISTVFQSYQGDLRIIMKNSVQ